MKKFSEQQQAAIHAIDGQILVIACPGSGKTTILIERLKYMISKGVNPKSMLNITFTKAAALEMKSRFRKECDCDVEFSTIHAFCYKVLRNELAYNKENIISESDKMNFIFQTLNDKVPLGEREEITKEVTKEISYVKNKELKYSIYTPENIDPEVFCYAFQSYDAYKRKMKQIDLDDMLISCRDLFVSSPEVLKKYQNIYKYISVDEFQDVNGIQAQICYMLAGPNGNLFIVGDDDQSIYKFRAADSTIMLNFPTTYPNCKVINMDTNYRSCKDIVRIAGQLIENNHIRFDKDFKAFQTDSGKIQLAKYSNSIAQAKGIVQHIKKLHEEQHEALEDIAILYRTNSNAACFIATLMEENIPFYTSEMPKSHHDMVYEDIVAYHRIANGQLLSKDMDRILNKPSRYLKNEYFRGCHPTAQSLLAAAEKLPEKERDRAKDQIFDFIFDLKELGKLSKPEDFIKYLSDSMNYRDWLAQYATYRGKEIDELQDELDILIDEASMFDTMEDWFLYVKHYERKLAEIKQKKNKAGICLSTFHSAKGLEWKTVFTVYVNEGITPFGKADTPAGLEEERRMFYVAITRAKENLILSFIDGPDGKTLPSIYLEEMGFFIQTIGAGDDNLKLDPVNGLG